MANKALLTGEAITIHAVICSRMLYSISLPMTCPGSLTIQALHLRAAHHAWHGLNLMASGSSLKPFNVAKVLVFLAARGVALVATQQRRPAAA